MFKVIIADDETMIKKSLKVIIERTGDFEVIGSFVNGLDALEFMKANSVDLLVTDIRMPIMDGLNLISALREAGNHTDVIILTGYGEFEYAQRAIRYGVTDYLLKPIVPDQLLTMLKQIVSKRDQQMKVQEYRQERLWYCKQQGTRLSYLLRDMDGPAIILLLEDVFGYITGFNKEQGDDYKTVLADLLAFTFNELIEMYPELKEVIHPSISFAEHNSMNELRVQVRRQLSNWMLQMANFRTHGMALTMKKALAYIQEHIYDENLTLQLVADELNLSVSYTSECIKETVGMNFTQYVIKLRMERAKVLLADPSCKMFEAAFQCGYTDYAHFTKTFKKYFGYSPKDYRKQLNGTSLDDGLAKN